MPPAAPGAKVAGELPGCCGAAESLVETRGSFCGVMGVCASLVYWICAISEFPGWRICFVWEGGGEFCWGLGFSASRVHPPAPLKGGFGPAEHGISAFNIGLYRKYAIDQQGLKRICCHQA